MNDDLLEKLARLQAMRDEGRVTQEQHDEIYRRLMAAEDSARAAAQAANGEPSQEEIKGVLAGAGGTGMSVEGRLLVEGRLANERKSIAVAYALWFILGIISAHRFYMGKPVSAIIQIASYFILVGFIWWLIDAFLIPEMMRQHTARLREELTETYSGLR